MLRSAMQTEGGARFIFDDATLNLRSLRSGGVFAAWDDAGPLPSYALAHDELPPSDPTARLSHIPGTGGPDEADGGSWVLRGGRLTVEVASDGALTWRRDGRVIRRDAPPEWTGAPGSGGGWTHRSLLTPDAAVFGLGGRSTALDRRPGSYRLWNTDPGGIYAAGDDPLSLTMPVYQVVDDNGCHLAFYDNTFDGRVEIAGREQDEGTVALTMTDGPLRYYVFAGSPAEVMDGYTALTGRPALPPRWALGYHQSRWGYGSRQEMEKVVEGFERHDLPLSGLWMDIDHLTDKQIFRVDEERYPDLAGFASALAERDIHLVAIVDPCVPRDETHPAYRSGLAEDVFCRDVRGRPAVGVVWPGPTVFPDFTSERARTWWGGLYREYVENGVDGFWHDMNEPSSFAALGDRTLPLTTRHDLDGRGGDHREAHNVYGLLMNRAAYEGLRELRPDRRPFLISRSGWAGMQRYAGTWSGDIDTFWESVRTSLTFTLGLSVCGVPYSGPDIGGFDGAPTAELYTRWFQLAAYLPFFRTHSAASQPPREPWTFGPETLAEVSGVLRDRYALLPYWYTLAWSAHRTGAPYVRPMWWADPADRDLRTVDDAFLLGDALLVAPFLEPGMTERTVRLPAGRWYDRRTGEGFDGPGEVRMGARLADGPVVLVRAGTVLPVADGDRIVLEAYRPAPDSTDPGQGGVLITDSGDGYGEPVEERFTLVGGGDTWTIRYVGPSAVLPYSVCWRDKR